MKRLFIVVLLLSVCMLTYAGEHLGFLNYTIDGPLSSFVTQLAADGYYIVDQSDTKAVLQGPYQDFNRCTITVLATTKSRIVWKVVVEFPHQMSWKSVLPRYEEYKSKYIDLYGQPTNSFDFFTAPYFLGDGYEIQAVSMDKCHYFTLWQLEKGDFYVQIAASNSIEAYVEVGFEDKLNSALHDKEEPSSEN